MFCTRLRTQRSASAGAPLTRTRLARPAGSASNDTATIGFSAEGEKQVASDPIVPWIAEFSASRLSPFGFPLSVPAPPGVAAGFTAATGPGSSIRISLDRSPAPKLCSLREPEGRPDLYTLSAGGTPSRRGGGFPLPMPKASQPVLDNSQTTIRPSATGFPAKLCSDRIILLLYRKLVRMA